MKNGPYELVVSPNSYPGLLYRGKYCYEHHLVYWIKNGRIPSPGENIHHINGNKRDNRIENLELVSSKEHSERHPQKKKPLIHGTLHGYQKCKCRCYKCRSSNASYFREYRKIHGR